MRDSWLHAFIVGDPAKRELVIIFIYDPTIKACKSPMIAQLTFCQFGIANISPVFWIIFINYSIGAATLRTSESCPTANFFARVSHLLRSYPRLSLGQE